MDDNEFKLDFDFEKEYGFDPDDFLDADGEDFDYSEFLKEPASEQIPEEAASVEPEAEDTKTLDIQLEALAEDETEEYAGEQEFAEYEDDAGSLEYEEEEAEDEEEPAKTGFGGFASKIKLPKFDLSGIKSRLPLKNNKQNPDDVDEDQGDVDAPEKEKGFFGRLVEAYLEPITSSMAESEVLDPLDPKYTRRKKKEKQRIFKEVYLPAIITAVALFFVIYSVVGAVNNAMVLRSNRQALAQQEAAAQADAAGQSERVFRAMIAEVETLAVGYDYDGALELLDSFEPTTSSQRQTIDGKRSELAREQALLVEWKEYSTIPNLSFHVLMADPSRACNKSVSGDLAGSYNKNFVSVEEFSRILNQLYASNYVLVDFNSFVDAQTGSDGNASYFSVPIMLPAGKKPIMITETMVNYFEYMVDPDKDGQADANGHGFANRLVVDSSGNIKAAYVDASGTEHIGNYDLVPVLEAFIQEHPDFVYRGARAILAVTGSEGVFGYRTNTSYVASRGQSYYDDQVSQAKVVVEALRNKGYTIACYTYSNQAYKSMTTLQIQGEMTNWTNQITPVLGNVDTIVFARGSDIEAYSGTTFNVLYNTGFRFFLSSGSSPRTDINTTFVRQARLMVTGEAMTWYSSQFSDYFDCNVVLDISGRGSQPTKS